MANLVNTKYFIYGPVEQVSDLEAEILAACEKLGSPGGFEIDAGSLMSILGVNKIADGMVLSVSSQKSNQQKPGVCIDIEARWSSIQMDEAVQELVRSRSGLQFAYQTADDDGLLVFDPDRVFFRQPRVSGTLYTLKGEWSGMAVDETFDDEEDLLDFVRDELSLEVPDINTLYYCVDTSNLELIETHS